MISSDIFLKQGGWTELSLPAIAEIEQVVPLGPERYHHRKVGELLHPEREPAWALENLKRTMGSVDFAAQYQQEPIAAGRQSHQMALVHTL